MSNVIIVLSLLFIWCWDYPADHPAKKFIAKFSFPFVYMGLWHGWAMFAPEPIQVNRWLRAILKFDDGSTEEWRPLVPVSNARLLNMLYARSFKYEHSILGTNVAYLYGPLCDFLARQAKVTGRQIASVELLRDLRVVNPYGASERYTEKQTVPFYRYDVVKRSGVIVPVASKAGTPPPRRSG